MLIKEQFNSCHERAIKELKELKESFWIFLITKEHKRCLLITFIHARRPSTTTRYIFTVYIKVIYTDLSYNLFHSETNSRSINLSCVQLYDLYKLEKSPWEGSFSEYIYIYMYWIRIISFIMLIHGKISVHLSCFHSIATATFTIFSETPFTRYRICA